VKSDYHVVCGRSENVLGPYVDAEGRALMSGGGTTVIRGDARFKGTGHNAFLRDGNADYLVYHAYDVEREGAPTLRISRIEWTADGWPHTQL
jgi:arabinan endo-1,5-alpha-L-arabinosidase